jgi:hypothetical protein
MTSSFEDYFSIIGSIAISLCCGLPLLIFAAIALFAGRKHAQNEVLINSAAPSRISNLKPGNRLVRLEGIIKEVPNKIDGPADSPLAFIRLKVEDFDSDEGGWKGAGDKMQAVPFRLEDETGTIWVDPQGLDKYSLAEGTQLGDQASAEAAAILAGLNPVVLRGQTRSTLWELRGGQRVTIIGTVMNRDGSLIIARDKKQLLIITSLLGNSVQVQLHEQVKRAWIMTGILGGLGLMGTCCGLGFLVFNLTRFTGS